MVGEAHKGFISVNKRVATLLCRAQGAPQNNHDSTGKLLCLINEMRKLKTSTPTGIIAGGGDEMHCNDSRDHSRNQTGIPASSTEGITNQLNI